MNLICYEIKSILKSSIVWACSLVGLFALMMLGAYPVYSDAIDEITPILANFPPEFTAAFGMNLESLFSYGGFYNFTFGYIGLAAAIMASSLSIAIFAREKRSKCSDFLLTKPLSRESIFMKKLVSGFSIIVITNAIYVLSAIFIYRVNGEKSDGLAKFAMAALGLFFTQLVFLSIGVFFATFAKKVRSVSGAATAFGFGAFILSAITNVFDDKNLDFIAPLKYFEPNAVFENGSYEIKFVCMAALIIVVCIGTSFVKFCKSDAHAV